MNPPFSFLARWSAGVLLSLTAAGAALAQQPEQTVLRYQASSVGAISYPELAEALGYLAPIKLQRVGVQQGGPGGLQLTATGQTEFAQSFNGTIIAANVAGAKLKAVVAYMATAPESSVGAWVLADSTVRSPRDLIGKKVGVNTLGALWDATIDEYLRRGGLSAQERRQVTLVPIPAANVEQALRQKQLDVALLNAGFQVQAEERGGIRRLFDDHTLFGTVNLASIVLSESFVAKNPNTTRHFVTAVARAIAWLKTKDQKEAFAVYAKYLESSGQGGLVNGLKYWRGQTVATPGGLIEELDFARWVTWQQERGTIKQGQVKVGELYTNEFNPYRATKAAAQTR